MIQHPHPTTATQKHVLAASGNQCAFPSCPRRIFDLEHETLLGTVAHIKARSESGKRFDPNQSAKENQSFANLIAMCAECSKIIDGPKWEQFSVETLHRWKREHESRIAQDVDSNWIRPANSVTKFTRDGQRLHFSYWTDRSGRARLFTREQLVLVNALMSLTHRLGRLTSLPTALSAARGAKVDDVLRLDWAQFSSEVSVLGDLCALMAMAPNVTFGQFLAFMVEDGDASNLIANGADRVRRSANGEKDELVGYWFSSDDDFLE